MSKHRKGTPVPDDTERTIAKGLGFCGNGFDANSAFVDVKDGKMVRIRPLRYDADYDPAHFSLGD